MLPDDASRRRDTALRLFSPTPSIIADCSVEEPHVGFEVLKSTVSCDVTACIFEFTYLLLEEMFYHEDGGSSFHRNVNVYLLNHMVRCRTVSETRFISDFRWTGREGKVMLRSCVQVDRTTFSVTLPMGPTQYKFIHILRDLRSRGCNCEIPVFWGAKLHRSLSV